MQPRRQRYCAGLQATDSAFPWQPLPVTYSSQLLSSSTQDSSSITKAAEVGLSAALPAAQPPSPARWLQSSRSWLASQPWCDSMEPKKRGGAPNDWRKLMVKPECVTSSSVTPASYFMLPSVPVPVAKESQPTVSMPWMCSWTCAPPFASTPSA